MSESEYSSRICTPKISQNRRLYFHFELAIRHIFCTILQLCIEPAMNIYWHSTKELNCFYIYFYFWCVNWTIPAFDTDELKIIYSKVEYFIHGNYFAKIFASLTQKFDP